MLHEVSQPSTWLSLNWSPGCAGGEEGLWEVLLVRRRDSGVTQPPTPSLGVIFTASLAALAICPEQKG